MSIEFIETGNQHLDNNGECVWKAPRYNFDTVFFDENDFDKYDGIAIKLNPDTILVDFDYHPEIGAEILRRYPTFSVLTDRGIHLYYRKPADYKGRIPNKSNMLTSCGALVDYKTGSKSMGTLKVDGKLRRYHFMKKGVKDGKRQIVSEGFPSDLSELPELPYLLYPHMYSHKEELALSGLDDGDGRNDKIYSHMMATREKYQYSQTKLEELATFINEHVFATPMGEKELESTLGSAINREVGSADILESLNPKENPEQTWMELVRRLNLKMHNGKLYFEKDKKWSSDENYLMREVFEHVYLTKAQTKEFIEQAKIMCDRVDGKDFHIQLRNDFMIRNSPVVEKMNGGFTPFNLDVDYIPDAYDEHVDKFLNFVSCDDSDIRCNIEEMMGHILWTDGFSHFVFFLTNRKGNNGKSTFLDMMMNFVGEPHTKLSIDAFDDPTLLSGLDGKLANFGDDIDDVYLDKSKNFKTIASGDPITVRPIYSTGFELRNRATMIFTANKMPRFKDKTGGLKRRIRIIPFEGQITRVDPKVKPSLMTDNAKSYILNLALKGLERLQANHGELTESNKIAKATEEYFIQSDSYASFMHEFDITGNGSEQTYTMYEQFCEVEGFNKPVSKRTFIENTKNEGFVLKKKFVNKGETPIMVTEFVKEGKK